MAILLGFLLKAEVFLFQDKNARNEISCLKWIAEDQAFWENNQETNEALF